MRLDHLLSKEEKVRVVLLFGYQVHTARDSRGKRTWQYEIENLNISGGDALWGHTRSHPEHDG